MLKDMKQIILLVGLLLTMNGWADVTMNEVNQEISIQGLSCLEMNDQDALEELWLINFQSEKISNWDRIEFKLREFPVTRINLKTIAWTQISDVPSDISHVYVLDRETMRQSGTRISIDSNGRIKIEARWFSQCEMLLFNRSNTHNKRTMSLRQRKVRESYQSHPEPRAPISICPNMCPQHVFCRPNCQNTQRDRQTRSRETSTLRCSFCVTKDAYKRK